MKSPTALLLYEKGSTCELLRTVILAEGCEVEEAPFDTQVPTASIEGYCLVLFDIQRPTRQLLELLRAWHDDVSSPALVVIGCRTAANQLAMLEGGADAYLERPLVVPELAAQVRAALRRFRSRDWRLKKLPFDLAGPITRALEGHVRLTRTECGVLEHLALHMNQTVPFNELSKILWGNDRRRGPHSLRNFIRGLRRKLEPDPIHPVYLITERAIGYRLQGARELVAPRHPKTAQRASVNQSDSRPISTTSFGVASQSSN
jgi:two-component system KDP operon response regulator KdpE